MKGFATIIAAAALLALPALAQAQDVPLPPGVPPTTAPPPASPTLPEGGPGADAPEPGVVVDPPPPADGGAPDPGPGEPPGIVADEGAPPAGTIISIKLHGRTVVVRVGCTADALAKFRLTSGSALLGRRRYQCSGERTLRFRAPRAVVRRARERGVGLQARVSAPGFASNKLRVHVGGRALRRVTATAATNRVVCSWCSNYIFGGFGNTQTLEYWVRTSRSDGSACSYPPSCDSWFRSGDWYLWWGDAQYFQNYASAYITTYRYWYYWSDAGWVYYNRVDIGP